VPKIDRDETPERLRPYIFHGLDLSWGSGKEAKGDCLFCGKTGKFSVDIQTGKWKCWNCVNYAEAGSGNTVVFLRRLWDKSNKETSASVYDKLAEDRGLLYPMTLAFWGICKSFLTGEWLVPGYDAKAKLCQLYRYVPIQGKWRMLATPKVESMMAGHGLFGVDMYVSSKPNIMLCEGYWDGVALWEIMRIAKETPHGFIYTASPNKSLSVETNVIATPGCNVFHDHWCSLFAKKNVSILFDSDHPVIHPQTKEVAPPVGFTGIRRAAELMLAHKNPPKKLSYLKWGNEGYDPNEPSGTDVRDLLCRMG
jgi:hypothetical protein